MNTATSTFVLSTKGSDEIVQGVTVAVTQLPTRLRWWLTAGALTRCGTRRRAEAQSLGPAEPAAAPPRI